MFSDYIKNESLRTAIASLGLTHTTAMMNEVLPLLTQGNEHLLVLNQGDYETVDALCYLFPIIDQILTKKAQTSEPSAPALVLFASQKQANQVSELLTMLIAPFEVSLMMLTGNRKKIAARLAYGFDLLFATPNKLLEFVEEGVIEVSNISTMVVTEAQQMIDQLYANDILAIDDALSPQRQIIMFDSNVELDNSEEFMAALLTSAEGEEEDEFSVCEMNQINPAIHHYAVACKDNLHKQSVLMDLLKEHDTPTLVFVNSAKVAMNLAYTFNSKGFKHKSDDSIAKNKLTAIALHESLKSPDRKQALTEIKAGHHRVIFITDLAARSVAALESDKNGLSHLINSDLPRNKVDYIQRLLQLSGNENLSVHNLCLQRDEELMAAMDRKLGLALEYEPVEGLNYLHDAMPAKASEPNKPARSAQEKGRHRLRSKKK